MDRIAQRLAQLVVAVSVMLAVAAPALDMFLLVAVSNHRAIGTR